MAPVVDGRDRRSSWRPFRATAGTSALVMPSWTTGDDGDEEAELEARKSRPRRRFRNRHQARQDNPQAPNDGIQAGPSAVAATAPPDPSPTGGGSDDSGIDSGVDSGIESSGEDDDGFGETTRVPRPRPPPPTTTSSIPGSVPATVTDGVSTSSGPSPGNRTPVSISVDCYGI